MFIWQHGLQEIRKAVRRASKRKKPIPGNPEVERQAWEKGKKREAGKSRSGLGRDRRGPPQRVRWLLQRVEKNAERSDGPSGGPRPSTQMAWEEKRDGVQESYLVASEIAKKMNENASNLRLRGESRLDDVLIDLLFHYSGLTRRRPRRRNQKEDGEERKRQTSNVNYGEEGRRCEEGEIKAQDSEPIAEEAGERVLKAKAGPKKKSGAHTDLACWRCGEKGHRKDECSKKVWCSSCKSTSHTDKACRKKERGSRCAHAQDDGGSRGRIDVRGTEGADFTFRAQTVDTSKSAQQRPIQEKGLIVDTGASSHIINDRSRFKNFDNSFKSERHSMELADGKRTFGLAQGRGDAQVHLIDSNGRRCSVTLKNALYIPSFPQELFSVKCATASGAKLIFDEGKDVLLVPDGTKFNIHVHNRMYYLQTECDESDVCNVSHDIQTWHEIMGHCNYEDILKLQDVTVGMHIKGTKRRPDKECRVCIEGKFTQMRNRDAVVNFSYSRPLEDNPFAKMSSTPLC
ncbi:hypothetical protein WMY93_011489 [Mugilogobius chulae]|uniref:CCHC-type domain-containing protein n=1 Tax=Mugilogobius chulae TaxID=88201 RepID=A0AAW0PER9_9GOBI